MSIQAEANLDEVPHIYPSSRFGEIYYRAQEAGYPARLAWSQQLDEQSFGYVVAAEGTRRVATVVEVVGEDHSRWLGQGFRVYKQDDLPEDFETVCQQMIEESRNYEIDSDEVDRLVRSIYLGHGMGLRPGSAHLLLQCNDPRKAETGGDMRIIASREVVSEPTNSTNPADIVRAAFANDQSDVATLALDIGLHMGELPESIVTPGKQYRIYRTRFHGYAWSMDDKGPRTSDLVLIEAGQGEKSWHVAEVSFEDEVSARNIQSLAHYGTEIPETDVGRAVLDGITSRISSILGHAIPNHLMTHLIDMQGDALPTPQDSEAVPLVNPYNFLDND